MIRDPPDHKVIRFVTVGNTTHIQNKKNKTGGGVILSHTTDLLLTPTESLQESDTKKTTLATNLSKVSRKKEMLYINDL